MTTKDINTQGITALAGGLGLVMASGAQAGIIYTDITDIISTPSLGSTNQHYFDIDNDLTDDFRINHSSTNGWYDKNEATITGISSGAKIKGNIWYADALDAGDAIGSGTSSSTNGQLGKTYYSWTYGNFPGVGDKFVGLEIEISGDVKFGWLRLNLSSDVGTMTVYDFAYEDSGRSIAAGDKGISVPEPSSMAMMATGALAIAAIRRRKRKQLLN